MNEKIQGVISYAGMDVQTLLAGARLMFAGDGSEIETIDFPFPRVDDGLMWGDYAWNRIEPCNRVDRFLSGVAYLDGVHPTPAGHAFIAGKILDLLEREELYK